jgi:hypothetical protein
MPACPAELVQVDRGAPPLVVVADGLDTAIHRLVPDELRLVEISRTNGLVEQLTTNRDGEVVAAVVSGSGGPHNVRVGPTHGPFARLTDTRPELRDIRWAPNNACRIGHPMD